MSVFSVIKKSQLEGAKRLDAEYYQPEYLIIQKLLNNVPTIPLKDAATITTGPAYSSEQIGEDFDIKLARIGDVVRKVDSEDWLGISKKEFDKFHNRKIKDLDILLSMTGDPPDVGKCNLITVAENQTLAFNQRVAKLAPRINPYYLFAFLSTATARLQAEKNALGIRQRNLGIKDLRETHVFLPNLRDQGIIAGLVENYLTAFQNSKSLYSQAENLLLEELGLEDFTTDASLFWTVNLSDMKSAGRIDAEYFQPKYGKLIAKLKKHNAKPLGELVSIKKGFEPGSEEYEEEGKLFIRVSNVAKNGLSYGNQKYINADLYGKLKKEYEPKVGEILLTKDATPGVAYVLKEDVEGIIAGGILRLKLKEEIEAEYLALCINSLVGEMQVERDAGGSVIAHWKPDQVKALQIPILSKQIQQKIAELVRKSHDARKKSKELLEEAKRKVEELIEMKAR